MPEGIQPSQDWNPELRSSRANPASTANYTHPLHEGAHGTKLKQG